jgi:photosystem II stability/assembly factor-like uncharacterized protein
MIYHSTDGGASWQPQTSGVTAGLNSVYFIGNMKGWCVGSGKTVIRTTDGGATWSTVTLMGSGSFDLIGVYFFDDQLGWASGTNGAIIRTTNGGTTWTRINSGTNTDLNKVVFTDALNGYAAGESGVILKSVTGGTSWTSVASGSTAGLEGLDISGGNVVAVGVFGDIRLSTGGGAFASMITGTQNTLNGIACRAGQFSCAVGEAGRVTITSDGGASWTVPPQVTSSSLYGVCVADAATLFACGEGGTIIKSVNNGASWQALSSGQSVALNCIDFVSPLAGWAVGLSGRIIRTTNGGTTWTAQASGTLQPLYGVDMQNDQTGTIVGGNGVILSTTNGGQTWTPQISGTADALLSVVASADNGWICGDAGTILVTTDAGQTWDMMTTNITAALFHISVTSPTTAAAVGEGGTILRSDDGGYTWTQELSHAMYDIYSVDCNGGSVRTAGDYGMVLSNQAYPVPVELLTFSGRFTDKGVELAWETASESNNAGFRVEREDSGTWMSVLFVPASSGSNARYSAIDPVPGAGIILRYRLRQIDIDGTEQTGPVIELRKPDARPVPPSISVYPNPARLGRNLMLKVTASEPDERTTLTVTDELGRSITDLCPMLPAFSSGTSFVVSLPAGIFPAAGLYMVRLTCGTGTATRAVMISQ